MMKQVKLISPKDLNLIEYIGGALVITFRQSWIVGGIKREGDSRLVCCGHPTMKHHHAAPNETDILVTFSISVIEKVKSNRVVVCTLVT